MKKAIRFLVMGVAVWGLAGCGGNDGEGGPREPSYCEAWCGWSWDCAPEGTHFEAVNRELYVLGCSGACEVNLEERCPDFDEAACRSCLEDSLATQCVPLSDNCLECDCLMPL